MQKNKDDIIEEVSVHLYEGGPGSIRTFLYTLDVAELLEYYNFNVNLKYDGIRINSEGEKRAD